MIHTFSVANFLSVREEIVLDLRISGTAPDLTCFRKSQARPGVRLPAVVVLMGPNGSGKTTVLSALARMFQIASADLGDQQPIRSVFPFMSSECRGRPSRFCVDPEADATCVRRIWTRAYQRLPSRASADETGVGGRR